MERHMTTAQPTDSVWTVDPDAVPSQAKAGREKQPLGGGANDYTLQALEPPPPHPLLPLTHFLSEFAATQDKRTFCIYIDNKQQQGPSPAVHKKLTQTASEQLCSFAFPLQFPQLDFHDTRVHGRFFFRACFFPADLLSRCSSNNSMDWMGTALLSVNHTLQVHCSSKSLCNGEEGQVNSQNSVRQTNLLQLGLNERNRPVMTQGCWLCSIKRTKSVTFCTSGEPLGGSVFTQQWPQFMQNRVCKEILNTRHQTDSVSAVLQDPCGPV